jgi:hypothetical protein
MSERKLGKSIPKVIKEQLSWIENNKVVAIPFFIDFLAVKVLLKSDNASRVVNFGSIIQLAENWPLKPIV